MISSDESVEGAMDIISLILFSKGSNSILHEACYRLAGDSLAINELPVPPQRHRQKLLQQREACRVMGELSLQIESSQWFPYEQSVGRRLTILPLTDSNVNDSEFVLVSCTEGGLICVHSTV